MIKRPLNSRFSDAVREGRKITTIRDNPWPVGKQIMLYNWSGAAYRSKQNDVAAVTVLATSPVTISRVGDAMTYAIKYWAEPSKDALMSRSKPSPEAVPVRVRLVQEKDWRKLNAR